MHPTWQHPHLTHQRLEDLLYQCYVDYYGFLLRAGGISDDDRRGAIFSRYMAAQKLHPMSGGIDRVEVDYATDYALLRRRMYGIDLVPLPENLALAARDEALNRRADWRVRRVEASVQS
jgi:hypothetical protein